MLAIFHLKLQHHAQQLRDIMAALVKENMPTWESALLKHRLGMESLVVLFEHLRSAQEQEAFNFIHTKTAGDISVLTADDADIRPLVREYIRIEGSTRLTLHLELSITRDLKKDLDILLAEREAISGSQFQTIVSKTEEEMNSRIQHESDRIISTIKSGPGDRIVDRVCFHHFLLVRTCN